MIVLALNTGSSSVKAALYDVTELTEQGSTPPKPLWLREQHADESVEELVSSLSRGDTPTLPSLDAIDIAGHRIVHGGAPGRSRRGCRR